MVLQPPLTPYLGPLFNYPPNISKRVSRLTFEKKTLYQLIEQMPNVVLFNQLFRPEFDNWQPFYWKGYSQTSRYDHVLHKISDIEAIRTGYKSTVRTNIRRAQGLYSIDKTIDVSKAFELSKKVFIRKKMRLPFSYEYLSRIVNAAKERDQVEMTFAIDNQGAPVAFNMTVFDESSGYNILLGVDKEKSPKGAVQLVLDTAIERAAKRVDSFNFCGSMKQEVERVYRNFGGIREEYYVIRKGGNQLITTVYETIR